MTPQQKKILILLALADLLFVCCLLPAVAFVATQPADADPVQIAMDTVKGFIPATPTRRPTSTPVPTPTLEAGWKLYSVPADKFGIAMPQTWDSWVINTSSLSADMDALAKKNPTIASALKAQPADHLAKLKFVGFETDKAVTATGFVPNINVMHNVEAREMTLDEVIAASQKELAAIQVAVNVRKLRIQAGDMVEFKFTMPLKMNNNQTVNMTTAQYVILRGRDSYSLSCVVRDTQAAKYVPICEKIGLSFRWVN